MSYETVTLGDIAYEITVGHVGSMANEYLPDGVPFLRSLNVMPYRIDTNELRFVSTEFHKKLRKSALKPGDVVIVRTGKPGTCAVIPDWLEDANCSDLVIVRCAETIKPRYLAYWVNSNATHHIESSLVGAVQQHFNVGAARKMPVLLPTLQQQDAILEVLANLDDKIDLNRQMNETLEEMARSLFRDWFVDFGPTRRQMEGAIEPVAIMGGAFPAEKAAALAPLFPVALAEDGLPEGWINEPLDQIGDFLNGLALQKYPAEAGKPDLPVIKIAELRSGVTAKSNRASTDVPEKYVIGNGDLIFSWSGSLLAKFWTSGPGALNQHLFRVTSETHPMWFVAEWVQTHLAAFQRIAASKAVTMGHIKRSHLSEAMCCCPPREVLISLGEVFAPFVEKQISNDEENQSLAEIRNLLLPKLMSGEIRVGDVEASS